MKPTFYLSQYWVNICNDGVQIAFISVSEEKYIVIYHFRKLLLCFHRKQSLPKQLLYVLQLTLNHWTTRAQNHDDGASVILVGLLKFGYHEYQWRHFWIILKKNKPILGYYATPDNEPHSIIIMVCSNSEWGINFISTTRNRPIKLTALINIRTIKLTALIKYGALNIFLIIWSFRPKCFWIVWW